MNRIPVLRPSGLLTAPLLGGVTASSEESVTSNQLEYVLGDPGRPARVPTLLIALVDDSGSVISPHGTDPLSNRYAEMDRAFRAVARRGSRRELGAVLHFDTPCNADVEPTSLAWWANWRVRRGLVVPHGTSGTSELGPGLRRAVALAQAHPRHEATLVVLSDFELFDPNLGQVLGELAAFRGDVHAVVLGSNIREDTFDDGITVTHVGRGDPSGAVARALFQSLVTHRPGSSNTSLPLS